MDDFPRLSVVDDRCRILICIDCQYAVMPAHIGQHFRTHHKRLALQQRRDIISAVDGLPILARVPSDVSILRQAIHLLPISLRTSTV